MKNIHVLSTNKPSRLFVDNDDKKLRLDKEAIITEYALNQHIYITSDEKIKEEDWFIHSSHGITNIYKAKSVVPESIITTSNEGVWVQYCKKIILTTDQDLIKDGVQAIDDDFLEWFVKNPSCEEVIVTNLYGDFNPVKYEYKIIIPKEDPKEKLKKVLGIKHPKQDWFCPKCNIYVSPESVTFEETHQLCNTSVILKEKPESHIKLINDNIEEFDKKIQEVKYERKVLAKQETIEEVAERISKTNSVYESSQDDFYQGFIQGAKWQAERMYSEKDMEATFHHGHQIGMNSILSTQSKNIPEPDLEVLKKEWFEQFKKKK